MAAIAAKPNYLTSKGGDDIIMVDPGDDPEGGGNNTRKCNCHIADIGEFFPDCEISGCGPTGCKSSFMGCGVLWVEKCDGECAMY